MKCPNCGGTLNINLRKCEFCGTTFTENELGLVKPENKPIENKVEEEVEDYWFFKNYKYYLKLENLHNENGGHPLPFWFLY